MEFRMSSDDRKKLSIYIHIPFCKRKCAYCDFLSFGGRDRSVQKKYIDALCKEIGAYSQIADRYIVSTIFIGGGTPSYIDADHIGRILDRVRGTFTVSDDCEITIEGNPDSLTKDKLTAYRSLGINRLSIGLQSTNDEMLRNLGRVHNYDQFIAAYSRAREAGFSNINIDIMSGLPGESMESYIRTLGRVVELQPEHISAYSLIVEDGTPLAENDELLNKLPSEEMDRAQYARTKMLLGQSGYERYEISNYSKTGYECRHNLRYWTGGEYLGVGLGASSYLVLKGADDNSLLYSNDVNENDVDLNNEYLNNEHLNNEHYVNQPGADYLFDGHEDSDSFEYHGERREDELSDAKYVRFKGVDNMDEYIGRFSRIGSGWTDIYSITELIGNCYTDIQVLKPKDRMEEFMFLGLRCIYGVSRKDFYESFGKSMESVYGDVIAKYSDSGHLICDGDRVRLSDKGLDVSNTVMAEFLL